MPNDQYLRMGSRCVDFDCFGAAKKVTESVIGADSHGAAWKLFCDDV